MQRIGEISEPLRLVDRRLRGDEVRFLRTSMPRSPPGFRWPVSSPSSVRIFDRSWKSVSTLNAGADLSVPNLLHDLRQAMRTSA